MRAALWQLAVTILLTANSQAQQVRKLSTLGTQAAIRAVSVCGETGLAAARANDGSITIWRISSGETIGRRPPEAGLSAIACSRDGKWLGIGRRDGSVAVTGIDGTLVQTLAVGQVRIEDVAFSPDNSILAVSIHESPVQFWDPVRGVRIAVLETEFSGTSSMDFSPDGTRFATADLDTSVRIYDRSGKLKAKYTDLLLEPFAISFMPDGRQLVVGGADCTLTFLDASDGHKVSALPKQPDPIFAAAALPDGRSLVSLQIDAASLKRFTVMLWDLQSRTPGKLPLEGRTVVGFGITTNRLPVLFTAGSDSSLTAWALGNNN